MICLLASASFGYKAIDRARSIGGDDDDAPFGATAAAAPSRSLFKDLGHYDRLDEVDGELKRQWVEEIDERAWSRPPAYTTSRRYQSQGLTAADQRCQGRNQMCRNLLAACAEARARCYSRFLRCRHEVMTTTCNAVAIGD